MGKLSQDLVHLILSGQLAVETSSQEDLELQQLSDEIDQVCSKVPTHDWLVCFPDIKEQLELFRDKKNRLIAHYFNHGIESFSRFERLLKPLIKKRGNFKNCLVGQLMLGSTPGSIEDGFFDFDGTDSICALVDNELKKYEEVE